MQRLANAIRLQAQRASAHIVVSRIGIVTNYNPANYTAKVALQPDGLLTGWLPIASHWIGNGWGLMSPPSINNMVTVVFLEGNLNSGVIQGRLFNNQSPPLQVESGEFWLVHAKGQSVKLTNDGALTLSDGQGAIVTLEGNGSIASQATSWTHSGDVTIDGNVNVTETVTATTDVVGGGISLKEHPHGGVQSGDDETGPPV